MLVERLLTHDVPVDILEDEEIVLATMAETGHARDGDEHPHPQQSARVAEHVFQFFFHQSTNLVQKYE